MNILKKWYWQWLDYKQGQVLRESIVNVVREEFKNTDKMALVRQWVNAEAVNSVNYTYFISAVADNSQLIDALVKSLNDKQLRKSL